MNRSYYEGDDSQQGRPQEDDSYGRNQGNQHGRHQQGGQEDNSYGQNEGNQHGRHHGGGGGRPQESDSYGQNEGNYQRFEGGGHQNEESRPFDPESVLSHAQSQGGRNHDSSMFSMALGFLQNSGHHQEIDEQELMDHHNKVNDPNQSSNSHEIGNAAALSAMQSAFSGSGGGHSAGGLGSLASSFLGGHSSGGGAPGGDIKSKLIGAAMSHAASMYDQKSSQGNAEGNKQNAVNQAAKMAMSLFSKGGGSSPFSGGGNSGGLSSLMNLLK